jgi:hypothetical protein
VDILIKQPLSLHIFFSKNRSSLPSAFLSLKVFNLSEVISFFLHDSVPGKSSARNFELKYENHVKLLEMWGKFNDTPVHLFSNNNYLC